MTSHPKLGVIVPSWNTVMEYECQRMANGALSIHSMRIRHTADTEDNLLWMTTQVPDAAATLAHAKVDVICYGCTAGGFLKEPSVDRGIADNIESITGIPAETSAAAVADAIRAVGARRISVASPYEPWLNERVHNYLTAAGFDVLAISGLSTQAHSTVSAATIVDLARRVNRDASEALFISCSNFPTLDLIDNLEAELGKPVITSNQGSMWKMLRRIGWKKAIPSAGQLFQRA